MKDRVIRCIVAGYNAAGEPDFWFATIQTTEAEIDAGEHIPVVKQAARDDDFEPHVVYDEDDTAGRAILEHFVWGSVTTIDMHP